MKQKAWLAALTLLLSISLVGCSGASDSGASGDGTKPNDNGGGTKASGDIVTIRTSIPENELSKNLIAEFENAHPKIKIEQEKLDETKLAAELATGDAPDVIRLSGVMDLPSYVIKGIALDITDRLDKSTVIKKDDLLPVANLYRFDGKTVGQGSIYGLPKDWSNDFAIFYNKKLFDAAGIPVPDSKTPLTWNQVLDMAKKMTVKNGDKISQYGLALWDGKTEAEYSTLLQYLLSKGVDMNGADFKSIDYNQPEVKKYMELWNDAVLANVGPNSINNEAGDGIDGFAKGKIAMIMSGYWSSGIIRGDEKIKTHLEDYGMLPAPIAEGGKRVSPTGGATGAVINKNSKHQEEAWTFFEWMFGGKPADERAKSGWGVSIFKSKVNLLPQESVFDKQAFGVLQDELKYTGEFLKVNPFLSNANTIFQKYMTPVYFKKSSIDDAIKNMTNDSNIVIEEAKNTIQ